MRYSLIITLVLIAVQLKSQNSGNDLNSLTLEKKNIESQIEALKVRLSQVNSKIASLNSGTSTIILSSTSNGLINGTVSTGGATFRNAPSTSGQIITTLKEGETIYLYNEVNNLYIKAKYYGKDGWISYLNLKSTPEIEELMNAENKTPTNTAQPATKIRTVDTNSPTYKRLVKIYGSSNTIKIMNGEIWKGMSHGMVMESLGQPTEQKTNKTEKGLEEIWKYGNKEIIFLNGSVEKFN